MSRFPSQCAPRCAGLLCVALSVLNGAAQFVDIRADIELSGYRPDKTNAPGLGKPRTISVHCVAGTNLWRIENDWSQNGLNKWFYDGTNVYESLQITGPMSEETQQGMKRAGFPVPAFESVRSNLTINIWSSSDGHPLGDEGVNLAWLAFCSGTYLKREGRLVPLPVDMLRHTPDRFAYTDRTETFQDALGLPRSMELFLDKSRYLASVEDFYKGWGERYLPWTRAGVTNLQQGALMFHYEVTATTNFNSWNFPLRFGFCQQGRSFVQNGDWVWRGVGTVKSIRETGPPAGVFDSSFNQTIVDYRFGATAQEASIYPWSGVSVPDTSDPDLQARYQRRVEKMRRHKESGK